MSAPYTDEEIEQHLDELDMLGPNAAYLDTGSAAIIRQLRAERRASEKERGGFHPGTIPSDTPDLIEIENYLESIGFPSDSETLSDIKSLVAQRDEAKRALGAKIEGIEADAECAVLVSETEYHGLQAELAALRADKAEREREASCAKSTLAALVEALERVPEACNLPELFDAQEELRERPAPMPFKTMRAPATPEESSAVRDTMTVAEAEALATRAALWGVIIGQEAAARISDMDTPTVEHVRQCVASAADQMAVGMVSREDELLAAAAVERARGEET